MGRYVKVWAERRGWGRASLGRLDIVTLQYQAAGGIRGAAVGQQCIIVLTNIYLRNVKDLWQPRSLDGMI